MFKEIHIHEIEGRVERRRCATCLPARSLSLDGSLPAFAAFNVPMNNDGWQIKRRLGSLNTLKVTVDPWISEPLQSAQARARGYRSEHYRPSVGSC